MSKGFLWFAQNNNTTDYAKLSIELAKTIKQHNRKNAVCVITDHNTKIQSEHIDSVIVLNQDNSEHESIKFSNEYKAFALTPFTHTVKLEADMLWTANTDWWWNHLCQHNMIFSVNCLNYKDEIVKRTPYRKLFDKNHLPNVYSGMFYFRKSHTSKHFFKLCETITLNWTVVRDECLINCHDAVPTTDVVYAMALRIMDTTNETLIDYPWFKFIHSKSAVNKVEIAQHQYNYLYPLKLKDRIYLGGHRLDRVWHYYEKNLPELLDVRVF